MGLSYRVLTSGRRDCRRQECDRQVANLGDNQQREDTEEADPLAQRPATLGFGQRGDDVGKGPK